MADTPANPANPQSTNGMTQVDISPQNLVNQPAIQQQLLQRAQQISQQTSSYTGQLQNFLNLAQSVGAQFSFRPNVLDTFANYTYHIKWSMSSDRAATTVTNSAQFRTAIPPVPRVTVAESGQTAGFNITDLELKNYCAVNAHTRSMPHTEFVMTLKEPYGFSLIDRIYSAASLMGVANHLTVPYFLEIWFTGYNEDGTVATPVLSSQLYKLFRVIMIKMDTETTSSGTTYRIEGIVDGSFGHADHIAIIANSLNIGPVTTIGAFFDQLTLALNAQQERLDYDNASRVQYQFNIPVWMRNWKFAQNPSTSFRSNDLKTTGSQTSPTITMSRGMDVETVLYFVLSMTKEGQDWVAGHNQTGAAAASTAGASIQANGMANIIKIHSKVDILGYDLTTNDYIRKITYTVTPSPTARALIDMNNVRSTQQQANLTNRLQTQASSKGFSKFYNYIYTGRNTDVIRFDCKLEWYWQTSVPSQLGENTYSNIAQGSQFDQNSVGNELMQQYNKARAKKAQAAAQLAQAQSTLSQNPNDQTAKNQQATAQQNLNEANAELKKIGEHFHLIFSQTLNHPLFVYI